MLEILVQVQNTTNKHDVMDGIPADFVKSGEVVCMLKKTANSSSNKLCQLKHQILEGHSSKLGFSTSFCFERTRSLMLNPVDNLYRRGFYYDCLAMWITFFVSGGGAAVGCLFRVEGRPLGGPIKIRAAGRGMALMTH